MVIAEVEFRPELDGPGVAAAVDDVQATVRARVPAARVVHLEPETATAPSVA